MARKSKKNNSTDGNSANDLDDSQMQSVWKSFEPIDNRLVRWILMILPWAMFLWALEGVNIWINRPGGVMWNTGYITGAFCLLALRGMIGRIPTALQALWDRQIVRIPSKFSSSAMNLENDKSIESTSLANEYRKFLKASQKLFNSHRQILAGSFGLFLSFLAIGIQLYWFITANEFEPLQLIWAVFMRILIEGIPAFLIGLLVWRMIIVGVQIWKLSNQFDISPRLGHPDQCGGLEPLGNLCFWNALTISIAGIWLGGWIVVGSNLSSLEGFFKSRDVYLQYIGLAEDYMPLYSWFLLIAIIVSGMSFFWPVWRIHQIMLEKRADIRRQLDQLSERIDRLTRELLNNADTLDPIESEKKAKKLERMRQVYNENKYIPVWPFNTKIALKFTASQLVPILTPILSLTGLGKEIVGFIASLLISVISS